MKVTEHKTNVSRVRFWKEWYSVRGAFPPRSTYDGRPCLSCRQAS